MPARPRARTGSAARIAQTAVVDPRAELGADTVIGVFCYVAAGAKIGDGTRIQSHTSIWDGVSLAADVFVGPGATFTNVKHPRAAWVRAPEWDRTTVERGVTIGARAVLVAPITVGAYAVIGAGAVVTRDVPPHAIVVGNPARTAGWACACGETLPRRGLSATVPKRATCRACGASYTRMGDGLARDERDERGE